MGAIIDLLEMPDLLRAFWREPLEGVTKGAMGEAVGGPGGFLQVLPQSESSG